MERTGSKRLLCKVKGGLLRAVGRGSWRLMKTMMIASKTKEEVRCKRVPCDGGKKEVEKLGAKSLVLSTKMLFILCCWFVWLVLWLMPTRSPKLILCLSSPSVESSRTFGSVCCSGCAFSFFFYLLPSWQKGILFCYC